MKLENAKEILILMSERIGDAIFCTPAVAFLKQQLPQARLTILALSKATANVFAHNPAVADVWISPSLKTFRAKKDQYEVLIDLHNSEKTLAYLPAWKKTAHISPRGERQLHQSEVALDFIQGLVGGALENFKRGYQLFPQAVEDQKIKALLMAQGIDVRSAPLLIGCHMGCYKTAARLRQFWRKHQASRKDWPPAYFAAVQKKLYEKYPHAKLVLTGVPSEMKLIRFLHRDVPNVVNLIGQTSVLEMAALMPYLRVFLTGDTGPLHVAVSTEVPIVALFGETFPELTGPWPLKPQHHIFHKNPTSLIQPEEVFEQLEKYL